MSKTQLKPLPIVILGVGLVAFFAILKFTVEGLGRAKGEADKPVHHQYRVDLISQEEAQPGKIVRATIDGLTQHDYKCSSQDASVAVVYVTDSVPGFVPNITVGQAKDPAGNRYATNLHLFNNLAFVTIYKGFSNIPKSITLPMQVSGVVFPITVTKIAPPERAFEPPSALEVKEAEKKVVAEYVEAHKGIFLRVTKDPAHGFYRGARILASDFCPETDWEGTGPWQQQTSSIPSWVKVQVARYRMNGGLTTLTYKNAQVRIINGKRVLLFPSKQNIGKLHGWNAFVNSLTESAYRDVKLKHSVGVIAIHFPELDNGQHSIGTFEARSVSLIPNVEDLGLDWVEVNMDNLRIRLRIEAKHASQVGHSLTIPELKIRFDQAQSVKVASQILIVPVHRVKNDPKLFGAQPVISPSASVTSGPLLIAPKRNGPSP